MDSGATKMHACEQRAGVEARPTPTMAVVVPAHQAARQIRMCIHGLVAGGFAPDEVVVVDDGSADATGEIARTAGAAVLRNETSVGPAEARNRGVRHVAADVVVFCDADVVVHPGARERLLAHFRREPELSAIFGSYDDAPPAQRTASLYRNLLHHFVHQRARPDASTFWTGFGAVRRADFLRVGGLDPAWQNIEDVEFGLRLKRAGGRVRLDRDLLCTHLKEWTLGSMFHTDWKGRAIPWTRLVWFHDVPGDDLNLASWHRFSAASIAALLACLVLSAVDLRAVLGIPPALAAFLAANRRFFGFLAARRGAGFALRAMPYHAIHHIAALLGYCEVVLTEAVPRFLAGRRELHRRRRRTK
jgi:glycosyltransferase involved in cell wall biosynthesis